MNFLRRLAIALYRIFVGSPARLRPRVRRSQFYEPKFELNKTYEYDSFDDQNEFDSQDDFNTKAITSYLMTHPYPLQTTHYTSSYKPGYCPQMLQWRGGYDEDYQDEYEDEYDEYELDDSYGTVEYRFETFGGDTFIEYSYEGDLDEQEIVQALNWLWTSSVDRSNLDRSSVLTGTLRMPMLPGRPIGLPYLR
ncbi:MAG: hypothetical protein KME15_07300 [Drouetiella hepatica Uher 2000/2452]|jgi:hypothetical protein|uniref:Uncharacterized protein n=1 Tax=Drouetiella hepatica Uher 2000/2452 TaxID=904376 RepID=A0A951UN84_9CYAN|nr:hypothetical protein [Drouetiella hepatica Uher 2000/2452]